MLYNILPPTLFLLSLSGVIVIVVRATTRIQSQELSASIQAAASEAGPSASRLLKPTTNSVHAITDRLANVKEKAPGALQRVKAVGTAGITKVRSIPGALPKPKVKNIFKRKDKAVAASVSTAAPAVAGMAPIVTTTVVAAPKPKQRKKISIKPHKMSLLEQADEAMSRGQLDQAEAHLVSHIVDNPKEPDAYLLMAEIACQKNAWSEALEVYEELAAWRKPVTGIQASVGITALKAGKLTKALQALQRAHEEDPANVEVLENIQKIARTMDNQVLVQSSTEKLSSLQRVSSQDKATA